MVKYHIQVYTCLHGVAIYIRYTGAKPVGSCYRKAKAVMAFTPVPHTAKAVEVFTFLGTTYSNTLWFEKEDFVLADQEALADVVDELYGLAMLDYMSSQAAYTRSVVYDMRAADAPIVIDDDSAGSGILDASEALPISAAMVCTLYTASRGRSGRGRLYVTGFAESAWDGNEYAAATQTAIEALVVAMAQGALTIGWQFCVCSHQINGVARVPPVMQPVTNVNVRNGREGVQRRRTNRG